MAVVKVHGGDFLKGTGAYHFGSLVLKTVQNPIIGEAVPASKLELVQVASEDVVKKFFGTAGCGLVGGLILGPVGALAGLLAGGRKKEITFIARFRDGRKLLATTDSKTFLKLQAACF